MGARLRLTLGLVAGLALSACGPEVPGADAAELEETAAFNMVPRSHAGTFVGVFDAVCTLPPTRQEAAARSLGYVPAERARGGAARLFVVDDRRPALRMGARLCLVEAVSRTGQTQRVRDYVGSAHPSARPAAEMPRGHHLEQMWHLPDGGLLATRRWRDGQNLIRFAFLRYREAAA